MKKLMMLASMSLVLFSVVAHAEVPHLINYQAKVTDADGKALNGSYNITFRIYDAETGGSLLWSETHNGVVVSKGVFATMLGSVQNLNLTFDRPYWISIQIGGDPEMTPRQRIASVGYAITAERVDGKRATDLLARSNHTGSQAPSTISPQGPGSGLNADLLDGADFSGHIAILTGTVTNGGTIPLPSGYTQAQCKWGVYFEQIDVAFGGRPNGRTALTIDISANRVVTLTTGGAHDFSFQESRMKYWIIGIK